MTVAAVAVVLVAEAVMVVSEPFLSIFIGVAVVLLENDEEHRNEDEEGEEEDAFFSV